MADPDPQFHREYRGALPSADEPIDIQRYTNAFRRDWPLVVLIVLFATVLALVMSFAAADKYRATTRIVFEEIGSLFQPRDVEATKRELATLRSLIETPTALGQVAGRFPGLSSDDVDDRVTTSVDSDANIIEVSAVDGDSVRAAALANAVASTFLDTRRGLQRAQLVRARAALRDELQGLLRTAGPSSRTDALRSRISELDISIAGAGSELRIAESAVPPSSPYAPRPLRNALIAFFASLFVAALVVLARERTRPRIASARELSHLVGSPILARVPWVRGRSGRSGIFTVDEYEGYQAVQALLRLQGGSTPPTVVLVTSAVKGEGKSRVTAGLGLALAQSGARTLLVSADLRDPTLHELFDISPKQGLTEILSLHWSDDREQLRELILGSIHPLRSNLALLGSATRRTSAGSLLSSSVLAEVFEELAQLDYEYLVIDSPPLLGLIDARLLAGHADLVLVVGRLDVLSPQLALDMRDALDTIETPALGLVVVGASGEHTRYYSGRGAPLFDRA